MSLLLDSGDEIDVILSSTAILRLVEIKTDQKYARNWWEQKIKGGLIISEANDELLR